MAKTQTKSANPFMNADFGDFMDFSKFAEQFKMPGIDSSALVDSQRKNVEAFTHANRVALEGVQAVAQRQAEILRQAMEETGKAVREMAKPGQPTEKMASQAEMVKAAYESAIANLRELTEMSAKSNAEAGEVLTHRFAASLDEIKGVLAQTNGAAK